jgi:uncharacterized protein YndB with AHSA1/START domain
MTTTRVSLHVNAPRSAVYRALLDAAAVQQWMVPDDMTSQVHAFEAREGGSFRISLTYRDPARAGKTDGATDTFQGRFSRLVPDELVEQIITFETPDASAQGQMRVTYELADEAGGTRVTGTHHDVPPGVDPKDNELGWRNSLGKLAALVGTTRT